MCHDDDDGCVVYLWRDQSTGLPLLYPPNNASHHIIDHADHRQVGGAKVDLESLRKTHPLSACLHNLDLVIFKTGGLLKCHPVYMSLKLEKQAFNQNRVSKQVVNMFV